MITGEISPAVGGGQIVGPPGLSNYDLWLQAGNTGSLATYLASLVGPQGGPGPASTVPGPPGGPGATGPSAWAPVVPWVQGLVCLTAAPATVVTYGGETFVCTSPHNAYDFPTDLSAGRWLKIAQKGDGLAPNGDAKGLLLTETSTGAIAATLFDRAMMQQVYALLFGVKADGVTDDAANLRKAIAAAKARANSTLVLPYAVIAIGSTISAFNWCNVRVQGCGAGAGPGMQIEKLQDGTVLKWIGPAGGTMLDWQTTDTSLAAAVGNANSTFTLFSELNDFVLDGNGLAAYGLRGRGLYRSRARLKIRNVTVAAVDLDVNTTVPAGTGGGDVQQNDLDFHVDLTSAASVNAKAMLIGIGTSYQNTHHNRIRLYAIHQAGTGLEVWNADSNDFAAQIDRAGQGTAGVAFGLSVTGPGIPGGATVTGWDATSITLSANATATARIEAQFSTGSYLEANTTSGTAVLTNVRTGWSVDLKASPINGFGPGQVTQSARANTFSPFQGAAGVVSRQGYAAIQSQRVLAAYNNRIPIWTAESTGINVRIEGAGTAFGSTLSFGDESGRQMNQTRFETTYEGPFLLAGVDAPRTGVSFPARKQFASIAEFGSDRPLYISGPNPGFGFNSYYSFAGFRYGLGSLNHYAAVLNYDTGTGRLALSGAPPGNDGVVVPSLAEMWSAGPTGNRLGPALAADPVGSFDGQVYWNTALNPPRYRVYRSSAWADL